MNYLELPRRRILVTNIEKSPRIYLELICHVETKPLGTLQFDLSSIDLSQVRHERSKGRRTYSIVLWLIISPEKDDGMMEVSVEWQGKQCGNDQFHFDFIDE